MENGKDFLTQCEIGNSLVKMDDFSRIYFFFTQLNRFTFEASIIKTGYALECLDFGGPAQKYGAMRAILHQPRIFSAESSKALVRTLGIS